MQFSRHTAPYGSCEPNSRLSKKPGFGSTILLVGFQFPVQYFGVVSCAVSPLFDNNASLDCVLKVHSKTLEAFATPSIGVIVSVLELSVSPRQYVKKSRWDS